MAKIVSHGRRGYALGCRCDQCKCTEAAYQKDLRRRKAEAAGDFAAGQRPNLAVVTGLKNSLLTSTNADTGPANMADEPANSVAAAVQSEIDALGSAARPGLAAAALALARILDNPKAVSTQPAAAAKLSDLLEQLRKNSNGRKSKLATVRAMTSANAKTG
jgi:hypothetical protein